MTHSRSAATGSADRSADRSAEGPAAGSADLDAVESYTFHLPPDQIATHPASRRDQSRLLEVDGARREHLAFPDLRSRLRAGDCLVVNNVTVQPSRLWARKASGGRVELLVLDGHGLSMPADVTCLFKTRRPLQPLQRLSVLDRAGDVVPDIYAVVSDGSANVVTLHGSGLVVDLLQRCGQPPLPPYIVKQRRQRGLAEYESADTERYQTVYAECGHAVAAPTAGLHFTNALLADIEQLGVVVGRLRLDVGPGTFQPVRTPHLSEHTMHAETYVVEDELVAQLRHTIAEGGRVIGVGTTVVRALEDQMRRNGAIEAGRFETDLFIRPGHVFRAVDGMVTNFHLPGSTLLALVSAFGGYEHVMEAYGEAVARGYRFYSYGDAMLLWPGAAQRRGS